MIYSQWITAENPIMCNGLCQMQHMVKFRKVPEKDTSYIEPIINKLQ